ncbi:membrane protein [Streptococcus porcinus]|uniref:Rhodanese-like domain-containing protein n=1 Tax=Streptococcus porcinus TaxID=1340 RepID=A0A4U9Y1H8_STRPO|nr:rhodanese-like domain-containing protein [Streptococcus porcinus]MBA2795769.1 rhodanese-like domain-containing protein [Streptococcus porcinus]VTS19498.1 membrane protein [Streptococcus porcinus]
MSLVTILGWTILVGTAVYFIWNYFTFKRMVKRIDNDTFKEMMYYSQIIDLRDPVTFRKRHILGARNFPRQQFDASIKSLRHDKPILIYENVTNRFAPSAIRKLKKAGYTNLYLLKDGFDYWDGKTK